MRDKTKRMLDLTDKDSDPFLGMVKMVFETNKRYPASKFQQAPSNTKVGIEAKIDGQVYSSFLK
jgi:hypothetical protein